MKANSNNLNAVSGMMRNLFLGIAVAGMALMSSCSKEEGLTPLASDNAVAANAGNSNSTERQAAQAQPMPNENAPQTQQFIGHQYRLIVAFTSLGGGIDQRGMDALRRFIDQYQSRIGKQILYQSAYFGREGEVELRFKLREINEEAQVNFVAKVRQVLYRHESIKIYENEVRLPS